MVTSLADVNRLAQEIKAKVDTIPGAIAKEAEQLAVLIETIKNTPPSEDPVAAALLEDTLRILNGVNANLNSISEGIQAIVPDTPVTSDPTLTVIPDEDAEIE